MAIIKKRKEKLAIKSSKDKKGEIMERKTYDTGLYLDRLFDQFRSNFEDFLWNPENSLIDMSSETRTPNMDVIDLGDKYQLTAEIPGVSRDNINIEVTPNEVEISADQELEEEEKGKDWLKRERSSTSFYRYLELPEELKTNDAEAEFKDGVLTLTLPKVQPKPKHESKKVKIK